MKRDLAGSIYEFLNGFGVSTLQIAIGVTLFVSFLVYLDRDKYKKWEDVPRREKPQLIGKAFVLPILIWATIQLAIR